MTQLQILQLVPQVPFPLSDGGKVGIFNITKHLALRGHKITMVALDRATDIDPKPLREYCELYTVPHSNRNSIGGAIVTLLSPTPYNISKYRSTAYFRKLDTILQRKQFNVIHVDHLHMAEYGIYCKSKIGVPVVLREHNVESVILERYANSVRIPLFQLWLNTQVQKIRSYEAAKTSLFDLCCVITSTDEERLKKLSPNVQTRVIPGGVDAELFEVQKLTDVTPYSVSMFGSFDWIQNQDALEWFVGSILPRIRQKEPRINLYVIGKDIPRKFEAYSSIGVVTRGFVSDLSEELRRYEMTLVPVRIGGGMRLKILESFAIGVPVISTTIGCEGIECKDDEHLLIADTEDQFVDQVLRLLNDKNLQKRLTENAHSLVRKRYRWDRVAENFEQAYQDVIDRSDYKKAHL